MDGIITFENINGIELPLYIVILIVIPGIDMILATIRKQTTLTRNDNRFGD